jgi:ATP-dependent DNA helicase RecG
MGENQNIEYKQAWRDEYLKWICGFANAQGGKIFIGIDDDGEVSGVEDYKKLMDEIPNKTVNHLGLVVDVNLRRKSGKHYLEIDVPVSSVPISYHGAYHYRSGSTKQELKGVALNNWLLKKSGQSWEDTAISSVRLTDLDETVIQAFLKDAVNAGRISRDAAKADISTLLRNLRLMNDQGELTHAAILLFGKEPTHYFVTAKFKIGKFGKSPADLITQDIVEGNILYMADKVLEILKNKYLVRPISYEGLKRMEPLEYPEPALREAILNSIIHKDYSSTYIFLRIYQDKLTLFNPGAFPEGYDIERIKNEHSSKPHNRNIAEVFFKAGFIEAWGRGITRIIENCLEVGLPEPVIQGQEDGVHLTLLKDIYTEEYLQKLNLGERLVKAVMYVKDNGSVTNSKYQKIMEVSKATATRDLQELEAKGIFINKGTKGSSARYELKLRVGS